MRIADCGLWIADCGSGKNMGRFRQVRCDAAEAESEAEAEAQVETSTRYEYMGVMIALGLAVRIAWQAAERTGRCSRKAAAVGGGRWQHIRLLTG